MTLQSGPALFDRMYFGGFALLCIGFSAYFFYDWKIGYAEKNRHNAVQSLVTIVERDRIPDPLPEIPTHSDFQQLLRDNPKTADDLRKRLGQPIATKPESDGRTIEYFASAFGMATVALRGPRVLPGEMDWHTWDKTQGEIVQQFWCGIISAILALWVISRFVRASRLRVVIDDSGMNYDGRMIAFDDMVRLEDYSPKGLVTLAYRSGAVEKKLRLDNHKVALFDEIIDALCEIKGFDNPQPPDEEAEEGEPETDDPQEPADS